MNTVNAPIGELTASGVFVNYPLAIPLGMSQVTYGDQNITLGPDGNMWFTEAALGEIGRIMPQGVITEFQLPASLGSASEIVAGPDGNLWVTSAGTNAIGVISTAGVLLQQYTVPTAFGSELGMSLCCGITVGADDDSR